MVAESTIARGISKGKTDNIAAPILKKNNGSVALIKPLFKRCFSPLEIFLKSGAINPKNLGPNPAPIGNEPLVKDRDWLGRNDQGCFSLLSECVFTP